MAGIKKKKYECSSLDNFIDKIEEEKKDNFCSEKLGKLGFFYIDINVDQISNYPDKIYNVIFSVLNDKKIFFKTGFNVENEELKPYLDDYINHFNDELCSRRLNSKILDYNLNYSKQHIIKVNYK